MHSRNGFVAEFENLNCRNWSPAITDLTGINQLTNLKSIDLWGSQASDYSELAQIVTLEHIDVYGSGFDDADVAAFAGHPALTSLQIGWSSVTTLAGMPNIPNLTSLHAWGPTVFDLTPLTGMGIEAFSMNRNQYVDINQLSILAPTLQQFWISGVLQPGDENVLATLTGLYQLAVAYTDVNDSELATIVAGMSGLRILDIDRTHVTDLTPIVGLPITDLLVNLTPINTTIVDPYTLGINVVGTIASGVDMATYVSGIRDPLLKSCVQGQTQQLVNTHQLQSLHCANAGINDTSDLHGFANLLILDLSGNPILEVNGVNNLQQLANVNIQDTLVQHLWQLSGLPALQSVQLGNIPLQDLNELNNFAPGVVSGTPDQGALLADIVSDMNGTDTELARCVSDNIKPGMTHAAHLNNLDCSQHNNYNVTNLTHLDQLFMLQNFGLNTTLNIDYTPLFNITALTSMFTSSPDWDNTDNAALAVMPRFQSAALAGTSITSLEPFSNSLHLRSIGPLGDVAQAMSLEPLYRLPLPNLDSLSAARAQINLAELALLPGLRRLDLQGDVTQGDLDTVKALVELTHLHLSNTSTVGDPQVSDVTSAMPNLTSFGASGTAITTLSSIHDPGRFHSLYLDFTSVTDFTPLLSSPNLSWISIHETPISAGDVAALQANGVHVEGTPAVSPALSTILNDSNIGDAVLRTCISDATSGGLGLISDVTSLHCSGYGITDFDGIEKLPFLQEASFNDIPSASNWQKLAQIPALRELNIWNTNFNEVDLAAFNGHAGLQFLNAGGAQIASLNGINLPNLLSLHIWGGFVYDLNDLGANSPFLEQLALSRYQLVDAGNSINNLHQLAHFANLRQLWLGSAHPADIASIVSNDPNVGVSGPLRHLSVQGSALVGNAEITAIVAAFPGLDSLEIGDTGVTDLTILAGLTQLSRLDINRVPADQNDLNALGLTDVIGMLAGGSPLPGYLSQIPDPSLRTCVSNASVGMILTGQLGWLDCRNSAVIDLTGIDALTGLHHLNIAGTGIVDVTLLGSMQSLKEIYLGDSLVNDLGALLSLANLERLDMSGTNPVPLRDPLQHQLFGPGVNVTGTPLAAGLLSNVSLGDAGLQACFDAADKTGKTYVTELEHLDCQNFSINDISDIDQLVNLYSVTFKAPNSGSLSLLPLGDLRGLSSMRAINIPFSATDLNAIVPLKRLQYFNVDSATFSDLSAFQQVVNLREFYAGGASPWELDPLFGLELLTAVSLSRSGITDINDLNSLGALRQLYLFGSLDAATMTVVTGLSQLTGLGLGFDNTVTDTEFNQIAAAMTGLEHLSIESTSGLTTIANIGTLVNLKTLAVMNTGVTTLAPALPLATGNGGNLTDIHATGLVIPAQEVTDFGNVGVTVHGSTPAPVTLTLTLDPLTTADNNITTYSEQGYTLSGQLKEAPNPVSGADGGFAGVNFNDTITVTRDDNASFDVTSIDLAGWSALTTVHFTGNVSGGGTVTQSVDLTITGFESYPLSGFTNLQSFTFDDGNRPSDSFYIDNLVVKGPP